MFLFLDFRRLRASDLKAAANEKSEENTSGTKRKAQTSQVNNRRKNNLSFMIIEYVL